ncbi:EamA family transporter [Gallaecimonas sp. GXIMD4217]|uniref:DMT family transporter n=1 Tax=Gallaecimonas sp. GXIMD4217 TaxID=3131927 RepID=UPI00311B174E
MSIVIGLLAPVLWGSTYSVVGLVLYDLSPLWVAAMRALPAGLLLLLLVRRRPPLPWPRLLALSLANITLFFALLFLAAFRLPGAVAGTLGATLPLQLMLVGWLLYDNRPRLSQLLLALLGLAGVTLLLNPSAGLDPLGMTAGLAATALIALASQWMQHWRTEDLLGLTAWQLALGGILLVPLAWLLEGAPPLPSAQQLPGLAYLVLAGTALAYWAWLWSLRHLGTELLGMLALVNPVVAVALGVLLVDETLSPWQWAGIGLILAAIVLMKLPAPRAATLAPAAKA